MIIGNRKHLDTGIGKTIALHNPRLFVPRRAKLFWRIAKASQPELIFVDSCPATIRQMAVDDDSLPWPESATSPIDNQPKE
jgi:hypothetical protein